MTDQSPTYGYAASDALPALLTMNWKNPDYAALIQSRIRNLDQLRQHPEDLPEIREYYRHNPADFINDWGWTYDPRNVEIGLPATIPFILFRKQREWIDWVIDRWRNRRPGLCEKSRDMGVSWLAMSLSCTLCLFHDGLAIGVGSRKGDYVDKTGEQKPLLPKARRFMENLPVEFKGDWSPWRDAPFMRITFPETGSLISGEGGDDIGRGDRTGLYFVDEYAHFQRANLTEASLSQTTNCRIDMSSVRGMNNQFAMKRWGGKVDVFIFDWRDDPRKDEAWYRKQCEDLDAVVVAQEIDRDYQASVSGVVIPSAWARACIDAKKKLGIAPAGLRSIALDVADEGEDKNATCETFGTEVVRTREWSGKGGDIFETTEAVFGVCDEEGYDGFRYDSDGLGAGVRGDARILNERREAARRRPLLVTGFRGSGAVHEPEGIVEGTIGSNGDPGRTNQDYFSNHKAQGWWAVRARARNTYRWIVQGIPCAPDDLLSISSEDPEHMKLVAEMSQPTYKTNEVGKIVINKKPAGTKSPNRADALMIRFAPMEMPPMQITADILAQVARAGRGRRR